MLRPVKYLFPECKSYDTRRAEKVGSPSSSSQNVPRNGAGGGSWCPSPSLGSSAASDPAWTGPATTPASAPSSAACFPAANACRSSNTVLRFLPTGPQPPSSLTYIHKYIRTWLWCCRSAGDKRCAGTVGFRLGPRKSPRQRILWYDASSEIAYACSFRASAVQY